LTFNWVYLRYTFSALLFSLSDSLIVEEVHNCTYIHAISDRSERPHCNTICYIDFSGCIACIISLCDPETQDKGDGEGIEIFKGKVYIGPHDHELVETCQSDRTQLEILNL
jgi:hypothetical protein